MKKIMIFFVIIVIVICTVFYLYLNYKAEYNMAKKANLEFEKYLNEEVYGTDLATIINRAVNNNEKNDVETNNKGIYLNNDKNSISIKIKITDNDTIYQMEKIYSKGIQNFINNFGNIKFKCVDIKYHKSTNKVKYLLFEQISE